MIKRVLLKATDGHGPEVQRPPTVRLETGPSKQHGIYTKGWRSGLEDPNSLMILPQVHLRKPCYDFYFL